MAEKGPESSVPGGPSMAAAPEPPRPPAPPITGAENPDFKTNYNFPPEAFDWKRLPDIDKEFLPREDLDAFAAALSAPDPLHSPQSPGPSSRGSVLGFGDGARSPHLTKRESAGPSSLSGVDLLHGPPTGDSGTTAGASPPSGDATAVAEAAAAAGGSGLFITAQNDWAPVHERVLGRRPSGRHKHGRGRRKHRRTAPGQRTPDETREGYLYSLLKWPFFASVVAWIAGLGIAYLLTRLYVSLYENFVTWRGRRETLRRTMRRAATYGEWVRSARELDTYLGNDAWREEDSYAYYDSTTVRRVWESLRRCRTRAEAVEDGSATEEPGTAEDGEKGSDRQQNTHHHHHHHHHHHKQRAVEELRALVEACVKNNFVGIENPRLYSQTYYGTKNLVQNFIDEVQKSISFLLRTKQLDFATKHILFKRMYANYGRTALCLSGGAAFAYYHFGVVRALLDADLLPDVITGTSGGALVAALVATRTNAELRQLLVPALSHRITACDEGPMTWIPRWWRTGARFDTLTWAYKCSWFCRGSTTFREAYERTGRILNVTCVPADPHSPTILCNYLTSPDCVIWSAVLASAAVPGILNPVVLMAKVPLPAGMPDPSGRGYRLVPYSFGHKWKDGSLRTDIPVRALNIHFNVNFTIVSQVNPHINLFFFSSRGSPGHPVTHRKGRGWRGGYLGSATEQYLKLDMAKWLKVLRHLELLPRPLGQDWSQLWLQPFGGTVTLWPKSIPSDFIYILSDPDPKRLARMIHQGRQSAFPALRFIANRLRIERAVERGRRETRPGVRRGSIESIFSDDDLRDVLAKSGIGAVSGGNTGAKARLDAAAAAEGTSSSVVVNGEEAAPSARRRRRRRRATGVGDQTATSTGTSTSATEDDDDYYDEENTTDDEAVEDKVFEKARDVTGLGLYGGGESEEDTRLDS